MYGHCFFRGDLQCTALQQDLALATITSDSVIEELGLLETLNEAVKLAQPVYAEGQWLC